MKNMKQQEIDQIIKEALSEEEAAFYDQLDEQPILNMVGDLYTGRMKYLAIGSMIVMVILFGISIYCTVQFFQAEELREMMAWGFGAWFCILAVMANKFWQWMEMQKNQVLREIKRVELQIGMLNSKLK
jgi:hypothetical protein